MVGRCASALAVACTDAADSEGCRCRAGKVHEYLRDPDEVTAMAALRKARADATRATVAHRRRDQEEWTVRYERTAGKLPGDFVI